MLFLGKRLTDKVFYFHENFDYIFQYENNRPGIDNRLPAHMISLKPDYSSIDAAEKSSQPEDWLLHPTGFVFQFDAQKARKPV